MIAANILGILGIVLATTGFFIYMCSIKSFGVPYLSPIAPLDGNDLKDTFVRIPLWAMFERPETITRRYGDKDLRNKRND
jgi:spore germination protein KA